MNGKLNTVQKLTGTDKQTMLNVTLGQVLYTLKYYSIYYSLRYIVLEYVQYTGTKTHRLSCKSLIRRVNTEFHSICVPRTVHTSFNVEVLHKLLQKLPPHNNS